MKHGKTLSVSAFKQQCLELLNDQKLREQPITVSRRGKPVAVISAPDMPQASASLIGSVRFLKPQWESANFADDWLL